MQRLTTNSLQIKTEQSRGVLYCDGLSLTVLFGSESQSEDKAPFFNRLVRFSQKVDSEQGGKCVGRQACNNILHNTPSKVLEILHRTI